jgi:hypothetical protein
MFVAMTVFELQKPPEIPRIGRPKKSRAAAAIGIK